jgi:hypothetical protein
VSFLCAHGAPPSMAVYFVRPSPRSAINQSYINIPHLPTSHFSSENPPGVVYRPSHQSMPGPFLSSSFLDPPPPPLCLPTNSPSNPPPTSLRTAFQPPSSPSSRSFM